MDQHDSIECDNEEQAGTRCSAVGKSVVEANETRADSARMMAEKASAHETGARDPIRGSRHDRHSASSETSSSPAKSITEDLSMGLSARY